MPFGKSGKKCALLYGAQRSKSELLLFTDADCRIHPDWIRSYATTYFLDKPGLIIGLVDHIFERGLMKLFFRFDFISLVIAGAGSCAIGRPTLCNGANLAVKRDLYLTLADKIYTKIPSGDDVFLLHEVKRTENETIAIVKSKHSFVKTRSPQNVKEFFNQRIRWASKSKYYSDRDTIMLSLLVFITNTLIALIFIFCIVAFSKSWYFLFIPVLKMIADELIMSSGLKFFGNYNFVWLLPVFEVIYPFYIIVTAIAGVFDAFTWKSTGKNHAIP